MRKIRFIASLSFALLMCCFTLSARATCTQAGCTGGPAGCDAQLLSDTDFSDGCAWTYSGDSSRVSVGGNYFAEMQTVSNVYQSVSVSSGYSSNTMRLSFHVTITGHPDVGTERIYAEIRSSSNALLETVALVDALDEPGGTYHYDIDNYAGQTIRVNFRTSEGQYPGTDTEFHVDWAKLWVY